MALPLRLASEEGLSNDHQSKCFARQDATAQQAKA